MYYKCKGKIVSVIKYHTMETYPFAYLSTIPWKCRRDWRYNSIHS